MWEATIWESTMLGQMIWDLEPHIPILWSCTYLDFSGFGLWIWGSTYTWESTVWKSAVWESKILGRRILDLRAHIPILQRNYGGPFSTRCPIWGSTVWESTILGRRILDLGAHIPILQRTYALFRESMYFRFIDLYSKRD